ncbi:MAG: hypothetical protein QGH06_05560 [Lutibacter sp.]|jgi:hypothetical protein|nr:hypothetical protein [Lutibacter sp.]
MIASNIFRALGNFFTNVLFAPYDAIRFEDNWWLQNSLSWVFILITFGFFFYWLGELKKYKKAGNE